MVHRTSQPGSPIPPKLAHKSADWILALVAYRANERRKIGKEMFPDQGTLTEDIARSAESIEMLFVVAHEEATETIPLVIASADAINGKATH